MKANYQITVSQDFFQEWQKHYKLCKSINNIDIHPDYVHFFNLTTKLIENSDINKVICTKYTDFQLEVYKRYITFIKNQIYKILPLAEENGEWKKHLDTLIVELAGSNIIFLHSVNFISLIGKLETLKQFNPPLSLSLAEIKQLDDFIVFRKTIFECMNIAESLTLVN